MNEPMKALAVNCTLKRSPAESSCELLIGELLKELGTHGIGGEIVRLVDLDIKPGVTSDEGDGDDWPALRQHILDADIFVLGTPIWLGHPSSLCQRELERLDAFLGEQDGSGRMVSYDRVACVAVVGNEDGAHHVFAELAQGLSDVGFTVPAEGSVYWVGEAMQAVDFRDKCPTPEVTATATRTLARNAAHLAGVLKAHAYPSE
jgi:multimeric flavodoxin WrbA